jgi:hypothetical protein
MIHYLKNKKDIKNWIKKNIPKPILKIIQTVRKEKMKLVDLSYIKLIREKDLNYLSNPERLEKDLLLKLGLNDEQLEEFPEELYLFCGYGLFYWQYPNQFSKYLVRLSKLKIKSYLEIGVRHGGTFIITVEYLNRFHPIGEAVGIDIGYCPSLKKYKKDNSKIEFFRADSQSLHFKEFIKNHEVFDLVLIDGNHEKEFCQSDFDTVKDKANIIVFHDIVSDVCPGVVHIWNELKQKYQDEYCFFEYIDQYKSVKERTGQVFLGIGMAVKKKYLLEINSSFSGQIK